MNYHQPWLLTLDTLDSALVRSSLSTWATAQAVAKLQQAAPVGPQNAEFFTPAVDCAAVRGAAKLGFSCALGLQDAPRDTMISRIEAAVISSWYLPFPAGLISGSMAILCQLNLSSLLYGLPGSWGDL